MGIIYLTDIYPRKTESTHVINTTFFRVLVFPLQQNGEITDWSKCCLWQNKLFKWLITQMLKHKCRLSEGCIQLNRLLKHLSERIDILRRRVARKSREGLGRFMNCCLTIVTFLWFPLQEFFSFFCRSLLQAPSHGRISLKCPFPWRNFMQFSRKFMFALEIFSPFSILSRKYFS